MGPLFQTPPRGGAGWCRASESLSAVQQIASALGAAVITSVWFGAVATGVPPAMVRSLVVVVAVLVGCCALVALLPRKAALGAGH